MGWKKKMIAFLCTRTGYRSCGHDPILSTQRIPRGRDPIFPTQRIGAAGIRFYLHKRDILKNFPAARASKARNSYKNQVYLLRMFFSVKKSYKRNAYILKKISRCAGVKGRKSQKKKAYILKHVSAARAQRLGNPRRKRRIRLKNSIDIFKIYM